LKQILWPCSNDLKLAEPRLEALAVQVDEHHLHLVPPAHERP
jgi:hypothetical protein